jgi:hypothetical protein
MTDRRVHNNRPDTVTLNKHLKEAYLIDGATVTATMKTATTTTTT